MYNFLRNMLVFGLLLIGAPWPVWSQISDTGIRPVRRPFVSLASLAATQAMQALRAGDWDTAAELGAQAGPLIGDVVEWHRLRAGRGTFDESLAFLNRHPDWPGLSYLKQKSEEALPLDARGPDVIAFFADHQPMTGHGVVALVNAFAAIGANGDAESMAALAWLDISMTAEAEFALLQRYPDVLFPLHAVRLDNMLWRDSESAARRMLPRLGDADQTALAEARLSLRNGRNGAEAAVKAVPTALQSDPGLAYEKFRDAHARNRVDEATTLILEHSTAYERLGQPAIWARARRDLARTLMRAKRHEDAYAVASSHWLESGSDYADLEWLSGYLSLSFLDDPAKALIHFQKFRGAVDTPISLGRAGYWEGRAQEALGDEEAAAVAYAYGAEYQTSFYGLLAAERGGLPMDPELIGKQIYPPLAESSFAGSSVLKTALRLQAAGERDLSKRFLVHLAETLSEPELGTLGDLALALGEPHMAVLIAKQAAQAGITLPRPYYPVVDLGLGNIPVPLELALSIARRESEFNPGVASGVGARGLMQLMPGTAQDMAKKLGLPFSRARLFTDPVYNARLGTGYLAELFGRFGPNVTLVSAGYNAGPGRPDRWIGDFGDPRADGIDPVDWIEHIPFDETRNYVMRVAESLPIYRARLTGKTEPVRLTDELKR
ncbi:lytic transglycosylase domain-containing protein [Oceaniovalibus sp. ACAM 378]|uniref:lytic transglycosylase domain-containing protein n=1 Tax=Oceaniovalibus sp. ACAM 378 TaxID=2599923 RepID=UPI0011D7D6CB|nr:lytic transglycosylase domain-containing protein [Oceaniovalibus sp. ACAM 378]TYB90551.1 lytic transglycosylase domain-containing protein [Oceaniovalibus sp. ACAM 378]